jgi:hypothetical protein
MGEDKVAELARERERERERYFVEKRGKKREFLAVLGGFFFFFFLSPFFLLF